MIDENSILVFKSMGEAGTSLMTTKGCMEENILEKLTIISEDAESYILRTEWWLDGELVKSSSHVMLKHALGAFAEVAKLG